MFAYYVYYRVQGDAAAHLRQRVVELQADVQRACGVQGRLLSKRDEPQLWMEVYEAVVDAHRFEVALAAALDRSNVTQGLAPDSMRRTECFVC